MDAEQLRPSARKTRNAIAKRFRDGHNRCGSTSWRNRFLASMRDDMMQPDIVETFIAEYIVERTGRANRRYADREDREAQLAEATARIARLTAAILMGWTRQRSPTTSIGWGGERRTGSGRSRRPGTRPHPPCPIPASLGPTDRRLGTCWRHSG